MFVPRLVGKYSWLMGRRSRIQKSKQPLEEDTGVRRWEREQRAEEKGRSSKK